MQAKPINETTTALLDILNDGAWHDGNSLGEQLKVSRTSIWKAVKRLQAYGIVIDCHTLTGYRLAEPISLLDAATLKANIQSHQILSNSTIDVFESVESTNQYLAVKGQAQEDAWHICLAEHQSQGRGRMGRTWHSPFAKNIYVSCLLYWSHDISKLSGISLLVALAINHAVMQLAPALTCQVKWPNDVLVAGKKLAGTLLEVVAEPNGRAKVIIGIGMNVNSQVGELTLARAWTSLQQLTHQRRDRNRVAAQLLLSLSDYLTRFEHAGWPAFIEEWQRFDYLRDKLVTVQQFSETKQGRVQGVTEQGHLLLHTTTGDTCAISSGEASLSDV